MKRLLIALAFGMLGGIGAANAGGSFSISVPLVLSTPSYPTYPTYQTYTPPPQPQMCWNGYYRVWEPCQPTYAPPPVVYSPPAYIYYSNGYPSHHHHHHNHGYGYGAPGVSFSYSHR